MAVAAPRKTFINLEDNVLFSLPTKIVFGAGTVRQVGGLAERLRVRSAFIVTDAGVRKAGLVDGCIESLEAAGIRYDVFDDVGMDPTSATIYPATEQARAFGAEC